jgi:hypothetical protein
VRRRGEAAVRRLVAGDKLVEEGVSLRRALRAGAPPA